MNRTEWLESLKPGDRILLISDGFQGIRKIDRITPTGRIILVGSSAQYINGKHRLSAYNGEYIYELTEKARVELRAKIKIQKISKYKWDFKDTDKINAVYDILFGDKK